MDSTIRNGTSMPGVPDRRQFLAAAAMAGAGLLVTGAPPLEIKAASHTDTCAESAQDILNTALIAEQMATTFYYTGLTSRAITTSSKVAGSSGDPNRVSPDGNPGNVAYLQAALDQEQKHARILATVGATSPFRAFYFPASAFESLGFTSHVGTYLWVLDHLETAFISAYIAAVERFGALGRPDLATVALRFLGVECQHRALYRVISEDDPADNVTLEVGQFMCVGDAAQALTPYLTGHGISGGATVRVPLPTPAETARVIGRNVSM